MKNIHVLPTDDSSDFLLCIKDYIEHQFTSAEDSDKAGNFRIGYGEYANREFYQPQYIYITSDEEIKEGDWVLIKSIVPNFMKDEVKDEIKKAKKEHLMMDNLSYNVKKIILTIDPNLIKDGVQAIEEGFLKWLEKNPTCEFVEVQMEDMFDETHGEMKGNDYKVIIPQETLEEAAEKLYPLKNSLTAYPIKNSGIPTKEDINSLHAQGAKWQAEQDKEIINSLNNTLNKIAQKNIYNLFKDDIEIQIEGIYTKEEVIDLLWLLYSSPNREVDFTSKEELIEWFKQIKKK